MPIYLYWGEDDFAMQRSIAVLRSQSLDPDWSDFNYTKLSPDQPDAVVQALNLAMTPPFGAGSRLVWLADTTLCQRCPEELLIELERTLPHLPEQTVLLLTMPNKPDGRLKSTKLLQKHADIVEFSVIPPWNTDQLAQQVRRAAQEVEVKLTSGAIQLLVESIGNHSRQLYTELEKLKLFAGTNRQPIDEAAVSQLVTSSTQSSFELAKAIIQADTGKALSLIRDLLGRNEAPLRIVATLVTYFRTRLWIKLMQESGERDEREIARLAEVNNPKQVYFLQKEVRLIPLTALTQTLPILMELEFSLKFGAGPLEALQTRAIELCQIYGR